MKYYKKVNIQFDLELPKNAKILGKHGYELTDDGPSFIRKYVTKKDVEKIKNKLPKEIVDKIIYICYCSLKPINCHTHVNEKTILNYYTKTNEEKTIFYDGEIEIDNDINDNGSFFYKIKKNKLKEAESFVAKNGECWLLDVTQPHEVVGDNLDDREIVQIYLNGSFDELKKYFI